jgi:D-serine deaminase-like pyridoxal phosphate-dependent protein
LLGDRGQRLRVLVEVDSGQHRSGVPPQDAGELAGLAARCGLDVRGVFTFPGHSYAPDQLVDAARDESAALAEAAEALRAVGIEPDVVSGGSTPSLAASDTEVLTELRPGVYVFGDAQQWELGAMAPDDIALTCRSTVVSHAGGRLVLDAGSKALGADRAAYATGYGRLPDLPEARLVLLSEHHAVADLAGAPLPPIGSEVDVVPNHVCAAVNLADDLYVLDNGELRTWPVVARGQNS